jgi:hypothetical protein
MKVEHMSMVCVPVRPQRDGEEAAAASKNYDARKRLKSANLPHFTLTKAGEGSRASSEN